MKDVIILIILVVYFTSILSIVIVANHCYLPWSYVALLCVCMYDLE